jgi:Na+/H+-translocating membrane pyrophosphatase
VASAARRCYNEAIQIAFQAGYFAAIINVALAVFGISFLFLMLVSLLSLSQPMDKVLENVTKVKIINKIINKK